MASIAFPGYSPVPLGQAGTGEAFILQGGDKPLQTLQRLDIQAQKRARDAAMLKQKQETDDLNKFTQAGRLNMKGFLPWQSQIETNAPKVYDHMSAVAQNGQLNRFQKSAEYQKAINEHNSLVQKTNEVEGKVNALRQTAKSDKRYNPQAVETSMFKTFKDGTGSTVDARQYDTSVLDQQLENPDNFDKNEVMKQFIGEVFKMDQATVTQAARPGGTGRQRTAASNLFEIDPTTGKVAYDKKTNLPILKTDNPEAVAAADNDPFVKKMLDQLQSSHEAKVKAVMEKAGTADPLTPQEKLLLGQADKTRADFLNELALPFAYGRTVDNETYRAKPQPRAAAATAATPGPVSGGYGVESVQTSTGSLDLPTTYSGTEPAIYAKDGTPKPVVLKGSVMPRFNLQVPGQKLVNITNNTEAQDFVLKAPKLVLMGKDGNIFTPSKQEYGSSPEALTQWYVSALKKNPNYRLVYAVQATAAKGDNALGSEEEVFRSLKDSYAAAKTGKGASANPFGGGSSRTPSDAELRDKARKIYGRQNGTYYLPYEGDTRRKLDVATGSYRKQEPAMMAEVQRIKALAKQAQAKPDPLGFGGKKPAATTPSKVKLVGKNNALGF